MPGYLSFMSLSSIIGISLGCFVMIALLSIMNGFERELRQTLLSVIPHGELFSVNRSGLENWQRIKTLIEEDPDVEFVSPYTQITGLLQNKSLLEPIVLTGLEFNDSEIAMFQSAVDSHLLKQLAQNPNAVIIGKDIAASMGVEIGDNIELLVPKADVARKFSAPKKSTLNVIGVLSLGGDIDSKLGLMNLAAASNLLDVKTGASGLRLTMQDPFNASDVVRKFGFYLDQPVYMSDWTRTHGHIFQDIQLVRVVVHIVLALVIAVACFNVVATLVMAVRAKQSSIAILMSMGATRHLIQRVFLVQGLSNGVIGTVVGISAAILIVPNLSSVIATLENFAGMKVLSSDVYFIDYLPTELQASDVLITAAIAISLCAIAAFYPARKATKIDPAKILG